MRQVRAFATILSLAAALSGRAAMATCTVPYTLTNGATADATQVMSNFNSIASCTGDAGTITTGNLPAAQMTTNLSAALDSAFGSTRGSILYRGASSWTALGPGTSGYVLSTNGSGANPSWVAQSGGGGGGLPAFYINPQAIYVNGNGGPAIVWQALWLEVGDTVSGGAVVPNGSGTVTLGSALYGPGVAISGLPLVASGSLTSMSVTSGAMYRLAFSSTFTATTAGVYWVGVYQDISINMYTNGVNTGGYYSGSISSWPSTAPGLSGSTNNSTVWGYR